MEMGKKLEIARIEKGMSQLDLAQEIGLSQGMVGKYERGVNRIPPDALQKISRILEKSISYFYGEDDSSENLRDLLKNMVKDNEYKARINDKGFEIPMLDELYSTNVAEQISLSRNKFPVSYNMQDEVENAFAMKTSNLGTIDLDIAVDTTIVVSTNVSPINGDKVLVYSDDHIMVRSYYKKGDIIEFRSSNPMFAEPIKKSNEYKIIGVIIVIEKRL